MFPVNVTCLIPNVWRNDLRLIFFPLDRFKDFTVDYELIDSRARNLTPSNSQREFLTHEVIGYLPYWEYNDYPNLDYNISTFGRLYNFYAIDDERGICPENFHVPTDDEWHTIENYLSTSYCSSTRENDWGCDPAGDKMKDDINWNGTNWARY